jgi:ATP-dependent DNA helicase DinG
MIFKAGEAILSEAGMARDAAVLRGGGLCIRTAAGAELVLEADEGLQRLARTPHLVSHAPYLIDRLGLIAPEARELRRGAHAMRHFDVAELFLFVRPAQFAVPTARGIARALGLGIEDELTALRASAECLIGEVSSPNYPHPRETLSLAHFLRSAQWPWADAIIAGLRVPDDGKPAHLLPSLNIWDRLPEWEDQGPAAKPSQHGITAEGALAALSVLLGTEAEPRPQQKAYCSAATAAFAPRQSKLENHIVLAEAGTGLGKTLAYLAPAHVWAKQNDASVWISTFTKNLQRQLEQEAARVFPDPIERREKVAIRKGRENYLCLLNLQETVGQLMAQGPRGALTAGLIVRWARHSRDGDMAGGDFQTWLMSLTADPALEHSGSFSALSLGLTDRRGECIYSSCAHYRRCFIEKAVRASRKAEIVVANHALVLHQAAVNHALGDDSQETVQEIFGSASRIIFDEGHHLFDAADSAFSGHLTGHEAAELRRWIRGSEVRGRRGRSLTERLGDLINDDEEAERLLQQVSEGARMLPGPGWQRRVQAGAPEGPAENFLALTREQVLARAEATHGHTLETDCRPLIEGLAGEAQMFAAQLEDLKRPMIRLARSLTKKLDQEAATLDSSERARIEALARSLRRRGELTIGGWMQMLDRLLEGEDTRFVDWFSVEAQGGRESDIGLHCHWVDPTRPLAEAVLTRADGVLITSATLKDRPPDAPDDWRNAEMRTGVAHLPYAVARASHESPYDYPANARILIVNDVNREDMDQLGAAYRELFLAARGGALGLFTAISRLRAVHRRLMQPLAQKGLTLLAQHVDPIDTGTLVDMFRAERDACLLGTDAVRDGVDVPGDSLRLIVLDRVPWGQPTILERARRQAFGNNAYQDMIVRLKLRQGFGRLIRRASDRGVFVVLDARLASRFTTAFPPGVGIERTGLVDAIDRVGEFLALAGAAKPV